MSFFEILRHPIKALNKKILTNFIKDALEHLPELKEMGLNILKEHKDEFIAAVKEAIIKAVKSFITKIITKAKEKIVEVTGNSN